MDGKVDLLAKSTLFNAAMEELCKEHGIHGLWAVWIDSGGNPNHQLNKDGALTMGSTSSAGFGCGGCAMIGIALGLRGLSPEMKKRLSEAMTAIEEGSIRSESQHVLQHVDSVQ